MVFFGWFLFMSISKASFGIWLERNQSFLEHNIYIFGYLVDFSFDGEKGINFM